MKCEKCGAEATEYRDGHSRGWTCSACGWGCVTSFYEPFESDGTRYTVVICGNRINKENIKIVANVTGVNFLKAREMLSSPEATVFTGRAADVMKVRETLLGSKISFKIEPDFPY